MPTKKLKYAIIGAGAAGVYTAWRLANSPENKSHQIGVFDYFSIEGKPHVGGRLWSAEMPGLGHVRRAELGGMRYLSSQKLVTNVVAELHLKTVPFDVDSRANIYYFRSKVLRTPDLHNPSAVPFDLLPMEQGMSPGGLLIYAVESLIPNAPYLTKEEWEKVKKTFKIDGCHLYELGFWNLLQKVLSDEAYQYVYAGQGYNTIPSNWNAADAFEWLFEDFGADVSYLYVQEGYQTMLEKLLNKSVDTGNVDFYYPYKLQSFEFEGQHTRLVFSNGEIVVAEHVILAMPRRSLELIKMPENMALAGMLPAVEPQPMFKFFAGYSYPWWRVLGLKSGRTVTDLPLRQIYYWGSNYDDFFKDAPQKTKGVRNSNENSSLMTYLDGRDVPYWKPLFELLKKEKKGNPDFGILQQLNNCSPAVNDLIKNIQSQMAATHGVNYIPNPYTLAYADWTSDPFGGAYNLWQPGYQSQEIAKQITKPYTGKKLYICGEAYSHKQGWVEGAFETAEYVLNNHLNIPPTHK